MPERDPLPRALFPRSVCAAALTLAAFCYAAALFLMVQKRLTFLPPTPAVAVGRVTVDGASKLHDYLSFALFIGITSFGTLAFRKLLERALATVARRLHSDARRARAGLSFAFPFFFAPLLFLVAPKGVFPLLLPPLVGAGLASLQHPHVRRTLRRLRERGTTPFIALLFADATAWILFRYIGVEKRIAHIPTLVLELLFLAFFFLIFCASALLLARLSEILFGTSQKRALAIVAIGLSPLLLLPAAGLSPLLDPRVSIAAGATLIALCALAASRIRELDAVRTRRLVAWLVWPFLLFAFTFSATATPATPLDLFHRGETLGPASDYLRGKTPFTDVFVLHGMLEDGLLDSWLMSLFGRDAAVAGARITLMSAATFPLLYLVTLTMFDSIGLALASVALGLFTFVDNQRLLFHLAVVLFVLVALRRRSRGWMFAGGVVAAVALFYSFDMGLYGVAGTAVALLALAAVWREQRRDLIQLLAFFLAGVAAGAAPFLVWLASRGAAGAFFETSFLQVPAIIDAVWSLPYPDLGAALRSDLSLRTLTDFALGEQIRFILNPLVLAAGLALVLSRLRRRDADMTTAFATVIVIAAIVAQRSALGRADFRHQYFAAYLLPPVLLLLFAAAWQRSRKWRRSAQALPFVALALTAGAALAMLFLWVPDLLNGRIDDVTRYRARISGHSPVDPETPVVTERLREIERSVSAMTRPNDTVFDFSNQPALYFFTQRRNASRFYQVPIASPLRFEAEVIGELVAHRPRIVFRGSPDRFDRFDGISNDTRAPEVAGFIRQNYQFDRRAGGVELWTIRPGASFRAPRLAPPPLTARMAHAVVEEENGDFLLFPRLVSLGGEGITYWRTDLTLTNGGEKPVRLTLRLGGERWDVERTLDLRPHETRFIRDAVESLFQMKSVAAPCLIRYTGTERPLVVATTYDEARPDSLSSELPLDPSMRASSASPAHHLVLTGAAEWISRQFDAGVVNVGTSPASFFVNARDSGGRVVSSRWFSIPERGSLELSELSKTLGVAFAGTVSVDIDIRQGDCVAYASLLNPRTGARFVIPASVRAGE